MCIQNHITWLIYYAIIWIWHSNLIAGGLLYAFWLLQNLYVPLSHLGPLVICYLLPWHSIVGIQQSVVLWELLFYLRQEVNIILLLFVPCWHAWYPYKGAEKAVSLLEVYIPPWIGVLLYSLSLTVYKFWHYASVHSPRLGQCLLIFFAFPILWCVMVLFE